MGYFADSFAALKSTAGVEEVTDADGVVTEVPIVVPEYWADMAMYIGADGTAGWYTVIAVVMTIVIIIVGNNDEQSKYNKHQ